MTWKQIVARTVTAASLLVMLALAAGTDWVEGLAADIFDALPF